MKKHAEFKYVDAIVFPIGSISIKLNALYINEAHKSQFWGPRYCRCVSVLNSYTFIVYGSRNRFLVCILFSMFTNSKEFLLLKFNKWASLNVLLFKQMNYWWLCFVYKFKVAMQHACASEGYNPQKTIRRRSKVTAKAQWIGKLKWQWASINRLVVK